MERNLIINDFIEDGRKNIQQIDHIMGIIDDPFEDLKTLTFAGMLSYYGHEHINDIYLAFLKTNFVSIDFSIQDFISKMYHLSDKQIRYLSTHSLGTFYDVVASQKLGSTKYKMKRTIYLSSEVDEVRLLKSMVHQMNHVINSIQNPFINSKQVGLCSRMGVSLDSIHNRSSLYFGLEYALNELQVSDIMNEISTFSYYDVHDNGVKRLLEEMFNSYSVDSKEEEPIVEIVRPLYQNPQFNYFLVDRRISGKINGIKEQFDSKTDNSYRQFMFYCDLMLNGSDSDLIEVANKTTKRLVKQYNDNSLYNL